MKNSREFWDSLAKKVGADASVMDPNDKKGYKNKYLVMVASRAILNSLKDVSKSAKILEFGCGSGSMTKALVDNGYNPVGVDFSFELLKHARQERVKPHKLFVLYDGKQLPFPSNFFDVCVIHTVLQYMFDTQSFCQALEEINRILKPGGRLVAIERTCPNGVNKPDELIHQRSVHEILLLLKESGFSNRKNHIIRRGHFPVIYLIRYGFIPAFLFSTIGAFEELLGKIFKKVRFDYAEMIYVSEKSIV